MQPNTSKMIMENTMLFKSNPELITGIGEFFDINKDSEPIKYIYWNKYQDNWTCFRRVNNKRYYVKASKDKQVVINAHRIFCKKYGIV